MGEYRAFGTEQFRKDIRSIARAGHEGIARKLRKSVYPRLREHPHFGRHIRKLKGHAPETWRYGIGSWRFFVERGSRARFRQAYSFGPIKPRSSLAFAVSIRSMIPSKSAWSPR